MKKNFTLILSIFLLFTSRLSSQNYFSLFDSDSLKGFDETRAVAQAIQEGFVGSEAKLKMYRLKREFIDAKYGLSSQKFPEQALASISAAKQFTVQACLNDDFESSPAGVITSSSQISGWLIEQGYNGMVDANNSPWLMPYFPNGLYNPSSCNLFGCCPLPLTASELIDCSAPGGYIDQNIGSQYPIFSVFGTGTVSGASASNTQIPQGLFGSKVLRLNNQLTGDYTITRLTKTFLVSTSNDFYELAYLSVFAPSHNCCDAGALHINFYAGGNNPSGPLALLSCPSISLSGPSSLCSATSNTQFYNVNSWTPANPNGNINVFHRWELTSVDLSNYIGQYVTVEVIVSDCNAGGHFSTVYFDARCGSTGISASSNNSCTPSVTLTAPAGFASYQWNGPGGFSANSESFTPTVSGNYSLQLNAPGICAAISKTIAVTVSDTVGTINSSDSLMCKGESVILTALNMYNCIWSTGDQTPSVFVSPDSTFIFSVSGLTPEGCPVSATYVQHVEECTGINQLAVKGEANLFPNPNNGEFEIQLPEKTDRTEVIITNLLGQEIQRQTWQSSTAQMKLKQITPGVYFFTVLDARQVVARGKFEVR